MSEVPLYCGTFEASRHFRARMSQDVETCRHSPLYSPLQRYRETTPIRTTPFLGPCSRTIQGPIVILEGGGCFL